MEKRCAACGQEVIGEIVMGSTLLCRQCEPDVNIEVERLRAEDKPVNVAHIARRMYRERVSTSEYLLRDIPEELWDRVRHRAIDDKCSQREVVIAALRHYLQ
jgi:hypothetical protein